MKHHVLISRKQASKAIKYIGHDIVKPVYKDVIQIAEAPIKIGEGILKETDKILSSPSSILLLGGGAFVVFMVLSRR
jgi:hypothetical protein